MAILPAQRVKYFKAREEGMNQLQSAKKAGFSKATAERLERQARHAAENNISVPGGQKNVMGHVLAVAESKLPAPIPYEKLCPEAKRALEDFDYFRRRYFGHVSTPWQLLAIEQLVKHLESS